MAVDEEPPMLLPAAGETDGVRAFGAHGRGPVKMGCGKFPEPRSTPFAIVQLLAVLAVHRFHVPGFQTDRDEIRRMIVRVLGPVRPGKLMEKDIEKRRGNDG